MPVTADDMAATPPAAQWQRDLTDLLAQIEAASTPAAEAHVLTQLAGMDADFQHFLVARMTEQRTTEAATFLAALASHPSTPPAVRAAARTGLDALGAEGVHPAATGQEEFYTGWVQHGRERGEQIMILGWRVPDGRTDACVFLLDWRGDGLKDFYRTRDLTPQEWSELLEHNGKKGAALTEISLAEGRALLDAALAEGKRFSRPVPREYKLAQNLVQTRIFDATPPPETPRAFINPEMTPEEVVQAYVAALYYRDYLLAYELGTPKHEGDGGGLASEGAEALRREQKHAPRRREEVRTSAAPSAEEATEATVEAEGEEETVESSGRRVRHAVHERYTLARTPAGWRIARIARI